MYFPNNCVVSLLTLVEGRLALEIGLVGREGMVGLPLALGSDVSPVRALVQGTGTAMRMTAARFRRELRKSLPLQSGLHHYANTLMAQISQTALEPFLSDRPAPKFSLLSDAKSVECPLWTYERKLNSPRRSPKQRS